MPLTGTHEVLAAKIAKEVASNSENQEVVKTDWAKVANIIFEHFVTNAVVTGTCDGKPLVLGKVT